MALGDFVETARSALEAGDAGAAGQALAGAVGSGVGAGARVLLGGLCLADDDFDSARAHWEIAFRELRDSGDYQAAVRVAAELAGLHVSMWGNRAVGRGWVERGARLARRAGRCAAQGYLALAVLGCDTPDVTAVESSAEFALELAAEFGDTNLEVRALAEAGFAMVAQGRMRAGFARLDEAMAAITAGEVDDPVVASKCFCAMLSACDRSGDVERALEWTAVVAEFVARRQGLPRVLHTHCRAAYGSLLSALGRWPEAEQAMLEALSPSASSALSHRVETAAHLADLRVVQGRLEEAAVLLRPFEDCLAACGPLARLHLAQGAPDLAAAVLGRGLRELVGDVVRAGPLLELLVEAELGRDQADAAEEAAGRLAAMAASAESSLLAGEAALAAGRVAGARCEHHRAASLLGEAERLLASQERPLLAGVVRLELARVWACAGERAGAISEARAALAAFGRLGATPYADCAAALLRSLGDRQRPRNAAAAMSGLSARERQVLDLLCQGLTNAKIGERLYISPKTAEHHVGRVLTKLGARSRAEAAAVAAGLPDGPAADGAE